MVEHHEIRRLEGTVLLHPCTRRRCDHRCGHSVTDEKGPQTRRHFRRLAAADCRNRHHWELGREFRTRQIQLGCIPRNGLLAYRLRWNLAHLWRFAHSLKRAARAGP